MSTSDVIKRLLKRADTTGQTHSGASSLAVLSILEYEKSLGDSSQENDVSRQVSLVNIFGISILYRFAVYGTKLFFCPAV